MLRKSQKAAQAMKRRGNEVERTACFAASRFVSSGRHRAHREQSASFCLSSLCPLCLCGKSAFFILYSPLHYFKGGSPMGRGAQAQTQKLTDQQLAGINALNQQ